MPHSIDEEGQERQEVHVVELVSREITAQHYAERFRKPADDPHVQMNVDGNWMFIGLPEVRRVLAALGAHGYPVPSGWEEVGVDLSSGLIGEVIEQFPPR